jgi:maleate cis-trans isomerase
MQGDTDFKDKVKTFNTDALFLKCTNFVALQGISGM